MKPVASGFATADEAEHAFYHAFASCDYKAMAAVWLDDKVVCIHPGSNAIYGYDAVMQSWSEILNDSTLPDILFNVVNKSINENLAVHLVEEHIATEPGAEVVVLATNVYKRFEDGWLMIEHHASMIPAQSDKRTLQ